MTRPLHLDSHRFATLPQWIGSLNVRAAAVAARNRFPIDTWDSDGLGESTGFLCALPSGRVVLVEEHRHQIEHLGGKGAHLSADLTDVARDGPEAIMQEAVECLGLSRTEVDEVPGPQAQDHARETLAKLSE